MTNQQTNNSFKPINIIAVFKEKNPGLARFIPAFIFRIIHNILELDQINEILSKHGHKRDFDFANAAIEIFNVTIDLRGEENLPSGGPFIFVSNHPLGGFDGVVLLHEIGKRYDRKCKVLVNDILMSAKNMDGVFVPINKHGAQALEHVKKLDQIFKSEYHVMSFPSGLVSRRKNGVIRDPEWRKNFITKSVQFKRDIVPIHFSGRCSDFFYKLANLRKFLRIKSNLEMFFLPKETFKHRNGHYTVSIGKPVSYKTFDKSRRPVEWAALMREHCYKLADDPNAVFNPNTKKNRPV